MENGDATATERKFPRSNVKKLKQTSTIRAGNGLNKGDDENFGWRGKEKKGHSQRPLHSCLFQGFFCGTDKYWIESLYLINC